MSVADLHDLELVWPSLGPTDVIVTGTFDQWSSSIHLVKGGAGFSGTVKVPWGQKIAYKFIVDGQWQCREDRPQEDDGRGNINNILQTPERPLALAHDPPARLSIPVEDAHGDVENMVTAVEFLPPPEPATIKGSLPLPIPHITVEGLTPVSESKLNTAAATQGHASPASETPAKAVPSESNEAPSSCDVPAFSTSDDGSVPLPLVNGNGEAHDSHSISAHAPVQFIQGEFPSLGTAQETVSAPIESAMPQPDQTLQAAQNTSGLTDCVDVPLASVSELATKQTEVNLVGAAVPGHLQAVSPASVGRTSTSIPSIPASSTLTHKKRRSLFARIKHIFEKNKDKQEKVEKNKH